MQSPSSKIFFDILESTTEASGHWQVWWAIANKARPTLVPGMNRFPDFFLATERAHFNSIFINLAHLFDKRRDVSSIERYLRLAKNLYSPEEMKGFSDRLAKHSIARDGVMEIRNNVIAHKNAGLSEKQVFAEVGPRPRMIGSLVDECVAVVNLFAERERWSNRIFTSQRLSDSTLGLLHAIAP
jgi:hypothetical protein